MNTKTDIKLSPACVAAEEYERRNPNRERSGTELYNAFMAGVSWQARAALQSQDREDALRYRFIRSIVSASNARGRGSWQFHYDRLPMPLNNPMKGSVAQHFDEAIDHARRIEGDGE